MTTDGEQWPQARAVIRGGSGLLVVFGGNAAVLVWGRSGRAVAVAGAVTGIVVVACAHLLRFTAARPFRNGPFQGLSWADYYRVVDAVGRGEAVSESRLAGPALTYSQQVRRMARLALLMVPVVVVGFLLRLLGDELTDRRIARDVFTGVVLAAVLVRLLLRVPRARQAEERLRAAHPSTAPSASTALPSWAERG